MAKKKTRRAEGFPEFDTSRGLEPPPPPSLPLSLSLPLNKNVLGNLEYNYIDTNKNKKCFQNY
jgi:hypothetical protein